MLEGVGARQSKGSVRVLLTQYYWWLFRLHIFAHVHRQVCLAAVVPQTSVVYTNVTDCDELLRCESRRFTRQMSVAVAGTKAAVAQFIGCFFDRIRLPIERSVCSLPLHGKLPHVLRF